MANVIINESNLTDIANAIRSKNGTSNTYKPNQMAEAILAISSGIDIDVPASALTLQDDCSYYDYSGEWDWFINAYGDVINCTGLTDATSMFAESSLEEIPFEIEFIEKDYGGNYANGFCQNAMRLKTIQAIKLNNPRDISMMFNGCYNLREIPLTVESFSLMTGGDRFAKAHNMFMNCYSLRAIPDNIASRMYNPSTQGNILTEACVSGCASLDELTNINIGVLPSGGSYGMNYFGETTPFNACYRLKNITFNSPQITTNFTNQYLNITGRVGYVHNATVAQVEENRIIGYNSGITADKRVYDDATYQALKDDPDWYSIKIEYSRYNKTSAIATIASLPDASGGTNNVIKFEGGSGSLTDGGAINTMTEEEIAVATAKGWTVSYV